MKTNYNLHLIDVLKGTTTWLEFKTKLEQQSMLESINNKNLFIGKSFEFFTKYFFLHDTKHIDQYKNVWLFDELPTEIRNRYKLGNVDYGIDLVLEDTEGKITAVQCKYKRNEESRLNWSKDKLANLFGLAKDIDYFCIFTNASEIDKISKSRDTNFIFYNIRDLIEIKPITYNNILAALQNNATKKFKKFDPRDYQQLAIDKALTHYKSNLRGQLILPCGTGKTNIALWIKEALDAKTTLLVVPSLSLLRQIKNVWIEQYRKPFKYLCVCSDKYIDQDIDSFKTYTYEIDRNVSTDSDTICEFLKSDNDKVIFSTYQSLETVSKALSVSGITLDFLICDEAHKTAGLKKSYFGFVHDDDYIPAYRRMYMTATPRIVSPSIKKKRADDFDYIFDMSDEKTFGKEFYRMSFKEAIDDNILVDYQILAIGIKDEQIKQFIHNKITLESEMTLEDYANNVALNMVMEKYNLSHAISFHSKIIRASRFSNINNEIDNKMYSNHVSGKQPTGKRAIIMRDFRNSKKAVLSNARCLTEGIDIPEIDMVYYCDPKNSKVDIVQSTGRALRKSTMKDKKFGYIVVPIYHTPEDEVEKAVDKTVFKNLVMIIRSLADQDERLNDEISHIAYQKLKKTSNNNHYSEDNINSEISSNVLKLLNIDKIIKENLFDEIIFRSTNSWDIFYEELFEWLKKYGNYPKSIDNESLYAWVSTQRIHWKYSRLNQYRVDKLNSINFIWDMQEYNWFNKLDQLAEFNKEFGYWPRQRCSTEPEHSLAVWMLSVREKYKENILSKHQAELLKKIDLPLADRSTRTWNQFYDELTEWLEIHKDFPYINTNSKKEQSLYTRCRKKYRLYKQNKLEQDKKELLDTLNFNEFEQASKNKNMQKKKDQLERYQLSWVKKYQELVQFLKKNKRFPNNQKVKYERPLYSWMLNQRVKYKDGDLNPSQIEKLTKINFSFEALINPGVIRICHELKEFRKINSGKWPTATMSNNDSERKLAKRLTHYRKQYKLNNLSNEEIELLKSIGIVLKITTNTILFDERIEELKEMINEHGFIRSSIDGKTPLSYQWLYKQRIKFKKGKLTKEEIDKLEKIGALSSENQKSTISFDERFEELKEMIEIYGKIRATLNGKTPPIYRWLTKQRKKYRDGKLSGKEIDNLKEMGLLD